MTEKFLQPVKSRFVFDEELTSLYERIDRVTFRRKVYVLRLTRMIEGFIIGRTHKMDGIYKLGFYDDLPSFTSTGRVDFWKVATGMNKIELIPVNFPDPERVVYEEDLDRKKAVAIILNSKLPR